MSLLEDSFSMSEDEDRSTDNCLEDRSHVNVDSEDTDANNVSISEEAKYPQRLRKKKKYEDYILYKAVCTLDNEPQTYEEAISSSD